MSRKKTVASPSAKALLDRFKGAESRSRLLEALQGQKMVAGNAGLARDLAALGELVPVSKGTRVIEQGGRDNHVFLVLAGAFDIVVNGKKINKRQPSDHIGEMAAIQPSQTRSASVVAAEDSVLLKISQRHLTELGKKHPEIYRTLAKELSRRLMQRNKVLAAKRKKLRLLIASSTESLPLARAFQKGLDDDSLDVQIWKDGAFRHSRYAIESLEQELDKSDFAIAIGSDNVIFELGLFVGRLGRHRALLLDPCDEKVNLPSALTGLSAIPYTAAPGRAMSAALAPACARIREIIDDLGPNI